MSKTANELSKKKKIIMFLVLAVVIVIGLGLLLSSGRGKPKTIAKKPIKTIMSTSSLAQQSWMVKSEARIEKHAKELRKIKSVQSAQAQEIKQLKKQVEKIHKTNSSSVFSIPNPNKPSSAVNYPPPPKIPNTPPAPNSQPCEPPEFQGQQNGIGIITPTPNQNQTNETNKTNKTNTVTPQNKPSAASMLPKTPNAPVKQTAQNKQKQIVIPPGSFVKAVLLTGADVPTMGNGSVGPIPVVFRVMGRAQLPNLWKANIRSCFLVGQATCSLSSQRAYIRISNLSCIKNNGSPLVKSVTAYISGSDGKVGMSGRVVSKQGAILARSLLAGFVQGVGNAFSQSQTSISVSPLGNTQSVAPNGSTIIRYGLGNGVSTAAQSLAKFYMKMANDMFPVIEVNAGRTADAIFLKRVVLSGGK